MQDPTTRTLGSLLADPDTVVQRHAMGILKRLRARECPEHPPGACYLSCPFRQHPDKPVDSITAPVSPATRP